MRASALSCAAGALSTLVPGVRGLWGGPQGSGAQVRVPWGEAGSLGRREGCGHGKGCSVGFLPARLHLVSELHPHLMVVGGLGAPCWHVELVPEEPSAGLGAAGPGRLWTALPGCALPHAPSPWPLSLFGVKSGLFPGRGLPAAGWPWVLGSMSAQCGSWSPLWMSSMWGRPDCPRSSPGPHHTRAHMCSYMLTPRLYPHMLHTQECWSFLGEWPARTLYT